MSVDRDAKIDIADMVAEINCVPLETTERSTIIGIDKIEVCDDKYVVLDKEIKSLLIFDKLGGFIEKIAQHGAGPDEYVEIIDFTVSESKEVIYALVFDAQSKRRIFQFDLSGKMIGNFVLPFYACNVECLGNQLYYYSDYNIKKGDSGYNLNITSLTGEWIRGFMPIEKNIRVGNMSGNCVFEIAADKLMFYPVFSDTIYEVKDDVFKPAYCLRSSANTGSHRFLSKYFSTSFLPLMKELRDLPYPVSFYDLVFYNDYVFFNFDEDDLLIPCIYNRAEDRLYELESSGEGALFNVPSYVANDKLISVVESYEIHELIEQVKSTPGIDLKTFLK